MASVDLLRAGGAGGEPGATADDGLLVVIRPEVLETADHVLGNLFQRLYHGAQRVRRADPQLAGEVSTTLAEVEQTLQLLMDYIAPFPPVVTRMPAVELIESVIKNLAPGSEGAVVALAPSVDGLHVAVEPGRVSRALVLLQTQLDLEAPLGCTRVGVAKGDRSIAVELRFPLGRVTNRTSALELRWAVAEKLLELHGGSLRSRETEGGETEWRISVPTQA